MNYSLIIDNIWNVLVPSIIGNTVYDGLKTILGEVFDGLLAHKNNGNKKQFTETLTITLERNPEMVKQLEIFFQQKNTSNNISIKTGNIHAGGNVTIGNIKNG
ncbi:hypothetical protein [Neisseria sp.]|uniref:hypothetical protein n=1 Tax=Neisseria sp. TaxID=192066 RepID=UPI0035A03170